MNLFFYDGSISQGVAFEGLLNNGEAFANRLLYRVPRQPVVSSPSPHRNG